jgi:hypothetical protein
VTGPSDVPPSGEAAQVPPESAPVSAESAPVPPGSAPVSPSAESAPVPPESVVPAPAVAAPMAPAPVVVAVRRSRFNRDVRAAVAVLVGLVALVAAIFGTIEADTDKQAERASVMSTRLATQVFEGTAVVSQVDSFGLNAQQDVIVTQLGVTAHTIAGLQAGDDTTVLEAEDPIEATAADRLANVIAEMTDRKRLGAVPDKHTASVVSLDDAGLIALVNAQGRAVDLADQLGSRSTLLVYALSLVALAGVLAGLAGVLRRGPGAILALVAGFVGLFVAIGIGIFALGI